MVPTKVSTIAHADHLFCSPLSSEKVDRLLGLLDLSTGARVLDVGCGKGELLVRAVERYRGTGVGVDTNPSFLNEARTKAEDRAPGAIVLHQAEASAVELAPASFDAAFCVGSSHALGGYRATLRALRALVRGGGLLLMGEGYWKREPSADYLEALGATRDESTDHAGNVRAATDEDLLPLYSCTSSEDEWDHYEGLYCRAVERYVAAHPEDPDAGAMRTRIRTWRDTYLRWGRDTLGFGLYLLRKPA